MTDRAAIAGVFADMKSVKTRSVVQMIVEIPIEQAEAVVQMFGYPKPGAEVPVAVARLKAKPSAEIVSDDTPTLQKRQPRRWEDMPPSQAAALACQSLPFRQWLGATCAATADEQLKLMLGISSKSELDTDPVAAEMWKAQLSSYRAHQTDQRYGHEVR